jgi:tripartite-type tricarboxylate transporter receptor subunit TctC
MKKNKQFAHPGRTNRRSLLKQLTLGVSGLALPFGIARHGFAAQDSGTGKFPEKSIRLIHGNAPGASGDISARLLGEKISQSLGKPVVIEAHPGGGGIAASKMVAAAEPDGYTIFLAISSFITLPIMRPNLGYDPIKDFAPISQVMLAPVGMFANSKTGPKSLQEVITAAKRKPNEVPYATSGIGHMNHLCIELFCRTANIQMTNVPYRGGMPAMNDLLAGNIGIQAGTVGFTSPYVKEGRVHPLAIASQKRPDALPDAPTFTELGFPEIVTNEWFGLLAPAGTKPAIVKLLNEHVVKALALPEMQGRFPGTYFESSTPEGFGNFLQTEQKRWTEVIREAKITLPD